MLSYQKNSLLYLLAQLKAKLWNEYTEGLPLAKNKAQEEEIKKIINTIDRNLTSIEKQIKKL